MDTMPPIDLVHQAIHALYRDPDPAGKENASKWLQQLQLSVSAWKVADMLLHEKRDLESCYFAAQTMHTKIQRSFHELPAEAHESLKNSLLDHLNCVTPETNQVIVTQLCLSVADLALLMVSWQQPVEQLLERYGGGHAVCLLELLTVIPEEIGSRYLKLGANRRQLITHYCCSVCPLVLKYLSSLLTAGDSSLHSRILKCLASWLTFPSEALTELADSQLIQLSFQALQNHQVDEVLHDTATDCICAALLLVEEDARYQRLASALFAGVFGLTDTYRHCVTAEMTDKCRNLTRLFSELGETVVSVLVNKPDQAANSIHILDMLLMCVDHHDYEVAEVTFHFWYRLSEELWQLRNADRSAIYRPYFERLVLILCRHCQMDSDHDGTVDEQSQLAEFREHVADLVCDFMFVCGSLTVFTQMYSYLQQSPLESSRVAQWEVHEAALFIMAVVAGNVPPEDSSVVPEVVQAALRLPVTAHLSLRHTSTRLIGALAEWFSYHPILLEPALSFVVTSLHEVKLSSVAAVSLKQLCTKCSRQLSGQLQQLLLIVQALDSFQLATESATGVLEGVAKVVSYLPPQDTPTVFEQLCRLHLAPLQYIIYQPVDCKSKRGSSTDPVLHLDRLATLFKFTSPASSNGQAHPCKSAFHLSWPVLAAVAQRYSGDNRILERCCRCLRFGVRCLRVHIAELIPAICNLIVSTYQQTPHSCLIYLSSVLVDECGALETTSGALLQLLDQLWPPAASLLSSSAVPTDESLRSHPETVDDLMRLCTRLLQRITLAFLQHQRFQQLVVLAVSAVTLDHRDANSSVMRFLSEMLHRGRSDTTTTSCSSTAASNQLVIQLIRSCLQQVGAQLVANILQTTIFCVASFMLPDLADTLLQAIHVDRQSVCRWMEEALKSLPTENSVGIVAVTQQQMSNFHQAITSAEKSQDVVYALREFSRLYR